jgi:hypothetical protein
MPDSSSITNNETMARIASLDQERSVSVVAEGLVTESSQHTRGCRDCITVDSTINPPHSIRNKY